MRLGDRAASIVVAMLLLTIVLVGCRPEPDATVVASTPSPVVTRTPTPAATAPQSIAIGRSAVFRDGGIYSGINETPYVISSGIASIDTGSFQLDGRVSRIVDLVVVDSFAEPRLAALVEVNFSAMDLTPARAEMRLVVLGADQRGIQTSVTLSKNEGAGYGGPTFELVGSSEPAIIVNEVYSDFITGDTGSANISRAFDTSTGKLLWQASGRVDRTLGDIAVLRRITLGEESGLGFTCRTLHGIQVSTGRVLWDVDRSWLPAVTEYSCRSIILDDALLAERYVLVEVNGESILIDAATGTRLNWRSDDDGYDVKADPLSGNIFSPQRDAKPAEVFDPASGEVIFSMQSDQAYALQLYAVSFFDGKLYVTTTDADLVIDAMSGSTLERGWDSWPIANPGPWVLFNDGRLVEYRG